MESRLVLALLIVAIPLTGRSVEPTEVAKGKARPRLLLNLVDGSRIIGTTELVTVPLHSESLGDLKVPLDKVAGIKFRDDRQRAVVALRNGDRLDGAINLPVIVVATVFGTVRIPLEQVREFQVGNEVGGHAIQLKAADRNYIEIPASDKFDVTENWTLEFWASITGGQGENITPLMRGGDDCGEQAAIQMDVKRLEGPCAFFYASDANGGGTGAESRTNLMDGKWHHWAGVVRDRQIRLYVDGVRVAAQPYAAGATGSRCPLRIGYRATHGGCFIDATLDEIRISGVARYDGDFTPALSFPLDGDTIAYWRCNEGEGVTVHDETGKHNGVLRGDLLPKWVDGVPATNR